MIIDEGSCINIVSTVLLDKLNLLITKQPRCYKLQWLNEYREVKVNKQVLIFFL